MAIAFDSSASYISGANATTHSWNHTCTGSDLILWVNVMNSNAISVNGVTYNGVSMNQSAQSTDSQRCTLFYLINPSTGTNTVQVTMASSGFCYTNSASYTGVKQTGQPEATTVTNSAAGTTLTCTLTTVTANSWTVMGVRNASAGDTTASTGSFQRASGAGATQFYDSNGVIATPSSYSMSVTASVGSSAYNGVMAAMAPSTGGGSVNSNFLMFM